MMEEAKSLFPDVVIVGHEKAQESAPEPGLKRRVLAYNDKLFLVEHEMEKGWRGTIHSHPHDQIAYVVRGRLILTCEDRSFEIRTGDTFVVRGGVKHSASAIENSLVVDVFTPCREDYVR